MVQVCPRCLKALIKDLVASEFVDSVSNRAFMSVKFLVRYFIGFTRYLDDLKAMIRQSDDPGIKNAKGWLTLNLADMGMK